MPLSDILKNYRPQLSSLDLDDEKSIKFETYRYYIDCFVQLIKQQSSTFEDFVKTIADETRSIQGFKDYDKSHLDRFLMLGWNTEHLANINKDSNIDLIRINNQWKIVQIYYSIYCISEAVAYLIDGQMADGHSKCLAKVGSFLAKLKISPWNLCINGSIGKDGNAAIFQNFPLDMVVPRNNLVRTCKEIEMFAMCLRAEHRKRVREFEKPKNQKGFYKYKFDPGHTTILHFLYRLRILSNYRDVEIFLAEADKTLIKRFSDDLSFICFYANALLEILVIRKIGKKKFEEHLAAFSRINSSAAEIKQRNDAYRTLIK